METAEKECRRMELICLSLIAKETGRSDDMLDAMCRAAKLGTGLSDWEMNFLSTSFQEVINVKKAVMGKTADIQQNQQKNGSEFAVKAAKEFRLMLETEIKNACCIVLDLINNHLIPSSNDPEILVHLHNIAVDCHFSLAVMMCESLQLIRTNPKDVATKEALQIKMDRNDAITKSLEAQECAWNVAKEMLPAASLVRLDLALKLSKMFYKFDSGARAYQLVKEALVNAKAELKSTMQNKETETAIDVLEDRLTLLGTIDDGAHRRAQINKDEQFGWPKGVKQGNEPTDAVVNSDDAGWPKGVKQGNEPTDAGVNSDDAGYWMAKRCETRERTHRCWSEQ